jgi:hypothetical protein
MDVLVVCIAHRRFSFRVTLPLNRASASVPLLRSEAEVKETVLPSGPVSMY